MSDRQTGTAEGAADAQTREYVAGHRLGQVLAESYLDVAQARPEDPVSYLAEKLAARSPAARRALEEGRVEKDAGRAQAEALAGLERNFAVNEGYVPPDPIVEGVGAAPRSADDNLAAYTMGGGEAGQEGVDDQNALQSYALGASPDYGLPEDPQEARGDGDADDADDAADSQAARYKRSRGRRVAVAAMDSQDEQIERTEKDPETTRLIISGLRGSPFTRDYHRGIQHEISLAMAPRELQEGEVFIRQGDVGDYFYVLVQGHCDVYKVDPSAPDPQDPPGPKVNDVWPGVGVGDFALLYGAPRAATVMATEPSLAYRISGGALRRLIKEAREADIARNLEFLRGTQYLKKLNDAELFAIAQACKTEYFEPGEEFIRQGDDGDKLYFIEDGCVDIVRDGKKVAELKPGDYVGEAALLQNAKRNATVRCQGLVRTESLDRETFEALLGNKSDIMVRG